MIIHDTSRCKAQVSEVVAMPPLKTFLHNTYTTILTPSDSHAPSKLLRLNQLIQKKVRLKKSRSVSTVKGKAVATTFTVAN